MSEATHALIIQGRSTHPKIEAAIYATDDADAENQATQIALALEASPYYLFHLWRVASDGPHTLIGKLEVVKGVTVSLVPPGAKK